MGLKELTISGLKWSGLSQAIRQGSVFFTTVILARLLSPDDFGLIAITLIFVEFAGLFVEMGLGSSLVQSGRIKEVHYSSAFWLNIVLGVIITLIIFCLSPFAAMFFKRRELEPLLRIVALNFVISSFVVVPQAILIRRMDFKRLAIRDIAASVISGALSILLAIFGFGVWSLVGQLLVYSSVNAIMLWILSNWRPKAIISRVAIKEILFFGINVTGFNTINYLSRNLDKFLIGKILGAEAVGIYTLAYRIMLFPIQNISFVIGKVMFPALSKVKDDLEKVQKIYSKMVKSISLVTFPISLGIFALAPEIVKILLGKPWGLLVVPLRILCICAVAQSAGTTVGNIYLSQGRPDLQFKLQFIGTLLVLVSVYFGINWNLPGVALFYTLQSILWVHLNLMIITRLISMPFKKLYSNFNTSYLIAIILCVVIFSLKRVFIVVSIYELLALVIVSLISFLMLMRIFGEIAIKNRKIVLMVLN